MLKKFAIFWRFSEKGFCTDVVKSFDEIPGPGGIFGIGNFYNYTFLGELLSKSKELIFISNSREIQF
jgi:hypothetical protein